MECFRYEDLVKGEDLSDVAERAFGREGLGIAVVTGVPNIADARRRLFALGHRFATLPAEVRVRYEHPASSFSFGWSHGKETLEAGRPDLAKGSFYANPCYDAPFGDGTQVEATAEVSAVAAAEGVGLGEAAAGGSQASVAAMERYPSFAHPNVWPDADVPGFSSAFKEVGRAVVRVGELLARQCDSYIASVRPGYEEGKMARIIHTSRCPKGRLLHYFPRSSSPLGGASSNGGDTGRSCDGVDAGAVASGDGAAALAAGAEAVAATTAAVVGGGEGDRGSGTSSRGRDTCVGSDKSDGDGDDDGAFSDWCGWHHDHSALTGLVPAMFLDAEGREVANRDPHCGLYIRSRQEGTLVKAALPPGESASSCLLIQIGETTQVLSGGALQATPHAVRSTSQEDGHIESITLTSPRKISATTDNQMAKRGVSREAFAVFMQPEWGESMDVPSGTELASVRSLHPKRLLPREAAPITNRLRPGMNFGEFTEVTFAAYY